MCDRAFVESENLRCISKMCEMSSLSHIIRIQSKFYLPLNVWFGYSNGFNAKEVVLQSVFVHVCACQVYKTKNKNSDYQVKREAC